MKNKPTIIFGIVIVMLAVLLVYRSEFKKSSEPVPASNVNNANQTYEVSTDSLVVAQPLANSSVGSPLHIEGKAQGKWFFEASFSITVLDEDGSVLGKTTAKAQGDWQQEGFVNFIATANFNLPKGTNGWVVFENDNPSGLPDKAIEVRVPVKFSQAAAKQPPGTCAPGLACNVPGDSQNTSN